VRVQAVVFPIVVVAVGTLAGAAPATAQPSPQDQPTAIAASLHYDVGEGEDAVETPAPDVEIRVVSAAGEEIGTATSDEDGEVVIEVPSPGNYVVTIDPETLPDGVELADPDTLIREVEVSPLETQRVLYALREEGAVDSRARDSDWIRFKQLSLEGLKFGLTIAMMAIGLSLIFGTTGLTNFAHGELVVVGTILAWYLHSSLLWLPFAVIIAMLVMFGAGAGLDRILWRPLRHRGVSLIAMLVTSIGLSLFIRYLVLYIFGGRPRAFRDFVNQDPYHWWGITIVPRDLWAIGISVVVLTAVGLVLLRTRIGKGIRAVADNPDLARSSGIDVDRVILVVWGAGSSLACLGGVLFAMSELVDWQFGFRLLLLMFAGVTLGGLGTAFGAFVGSLIVGWMIQVSTLWISPELKNVSALGLLILILVVRPQGIFGQRERIG
jgi:branched-chain amino acid transport system permease protein